MKTRGKMYAFLTDYVCVSGIFFRVLAKKSIHNSRIQCMDFVVISVEFLQVRQQSWRSYSIPPIYHYYFCVFCRSYHTIPRRTPRTWQYHTDQSQTSQRSRQYRLWLFMSQSLYYFVVITNILYIDRMVIS
jgi:hypothetical protein